jgi:hypothetical protein
MTTPGHLVVNAELYSLCYRLLYATPQEDLSKTRSLFRTFKEIVRREKLDVGGSHEELFDWFDLQRKEVIKRILPPIPDVLKD